MSNRDPVFSLCPVLQEYPGIKFSVIFGHETLDGRVKGLSSPAQSMVFIWISMTSDSSAKMTWSMVRTKHPGLTLTTSLDWMHLASTEFLLWQVGVNGSYGVDCPTVFGQFKNFLSSFCYFELACHLNHF